MNAPTIQVSSSVEQRFMHASSVDTACIPKDVEYWVALHVKPIPHGELGSRSIYTILLVSLCAVSSPSETPLINLPHLLKTRARKRRYNLRAYLKALPYERLQLAHVLPEHLGPHPVLGDDFISRISEHDGHPERGRQRATKRVVIGRRNTAEYSLSHLTQARSRLALSVALYGILPSHMYLRSAGSCGGRYGRQLGDESGRQLTSPSRVIGSSSGQGEVFPKPLLCLIPPRAQPWRASSPKISCLIQPCDLARSVTRTRGIEMKSLMARTSSYNKTDRPRNIAKCQRLGQPQT